MESFLERSRDADLDQLMDELASRSRGNKRRSMRLMAWKMTVTGSYTVKRLIDIVASLMGMLLLSPVFLAIAAAVKISSPGPVIFSQIRVGRYGRQFKFFKFRSMRQDAEAQKDGLMDKNESSDGVIFKMKDDPRITRVGKFLRRCLWQIKGRSEIPFHEQVQLDKEYILTPGIWKDIVILLKTIPAIIGGRGAY